MNFDEICNFGELRILNCDKILKFCISDQNLITNLDRSRRQFSNDTKITKFGQILVHKIKILTCWSWAIIFSLLTKAPRSSLTSLDPDVGKMNIFQNLSSWLNYKKQRTLKSVCSIIRHLCTIVTLIGPTRRWPRPWRLSISGPRCFQNRRPWPWAPWSACPASPAYSATNPPSKTIKILA